MSIQLRSFALVSLSLLALACGSEDPKAQDKCETLVVSYCDRVASCAERAGVLDASYSADDLRDDCELSFNGDARCEDAVQVSSRYDQCIGAVKSLSCDDINDALVSSEPTPLPSSCEKVILHPAD
ncbi:MAG TPA: hypothetical protein VFX59_19490 [Polyangiales bacterium]|nr:hypothetical protein [Polyangiales bacterium]